MFRLKAVPFRSIGHETRRLLCLMSWRKSERTTGTRGSTRKRSHGGMNESKSADVPDIHAIVPSVHPLPNTAKAVEGVARDTTAAGRGLAGLLLRMLQNGMRTSQGRQTYQISTPSSHLYILSRTQQKPPVELCYVLGVVEGTARDTTISAGEKHGAEKSTGAEKLCRGGGM
ncbi:uncharacterized protein STEHIDRAFT_108245 [Stereum hirsutum FP-91666 SS1]|uniref:uncharacterized protein n=1 Tax=Stereum hirsutum (strain FP-91666) TaxID=721885 RepID=UPI000440D1E3|nr:uncharacterized protein STEHIDRAFT_108245 [Stereum hirsutum FP-91666 SS1]EIM89522.1 hypothetical protein STEHIDRAFT_108245 [Stereum hirsutum FP-91666 SS1]